MNVGVSYTPVKTDTTTVSSRQLCEQSGATYRQIDEWTRQALLVTVNSVPGTGTPRRYSLEQVGIARGLARWSAFVAIGPGRPGSMPTMSALISAGGDGPVMLAPGIYVVPAELAAD